MPEIVHEHEFLHLSTMGGVRILDCACGARIKRFKTADGAESVMPYAPGETSVENALYDVAVPAHTYIEVRGGQPT